MPRHLLFVLIGHLAHSIRHPLLASLGRILHISHLLMHHRLLEIVHNPDVVAFYNMIRQSLSLLLHQLIAQLLILLLLLLQSQLVVGPFLEVRWQGLYLDEVIVFIRWPLW